MASINLLNLNRDVLFLILSYLSVNDLGRLAQVCRQLHNFCNQDAVWRNDYKKRLLASCSRNQENFPSLNLKEICRVSRNWENGLMTDRQLMKFKSQLMPWLQLQNEHLYMSHGASLRCYHIRKNGSLSRHPLLICNKHTYDICHFVVNDGYIVTGGRDHQINIWKLTRGPNVQFIRSLIGHSCKVSCIDSQDGLVLSGSADHSWRLWSMDRDECLLESEMPDRLLSVAINPWDKNMITGTSCVNDRKPLDIWNTENGKHMVTLGSNFQKGAGVLDVQFEDPHTALSCGYDTYLRIWDTRASRSCVRAYEEMDDNALYCLRSNGGYLIATGSSRFGVVRLWDKRMTKCIHKFYVGGNKSGSVYSLQFNLKHLYVSLAHSIQTLDFC
ncbi:F-box/WD repeat-containing protein 4-like [Anneissia japonica]|uniref:F-box/WD repeat-containing protein 4-like n=1 Tax=Anneissia japonica TaxID=1529436 RepID=UPI001425AF55|nr:F-box/WD repeat-containing protein 4-like [Anneissia japonica]XP_033122457.1 F-box/WD repeat-containing protein 4-like [Anneissia japonica]